MHATRRFTSIPGTVRSGYTNASEDATAHELPSDELPSSDRARMTSRDLESQPSKNDPGQCSHRERYLAPVPGKITRSEVTADPAENHLSEFSGRSCRQQCGAAEIHVGGKISHDVELDTDPVGVNFVTQAFKPAFQ